MEPILDIETYPGYWNISWILENSWILEHIMDTGTFPGYWNISWVLKLILYSETYHEHLHIS